MWLAYRLGAELFSPAVGVVTALVVLTRPALERDALIGYQDTAFAVLIVWAVLLEARQAKRGVPVLVAARARGADAARGVGAGRALHALPVARRERARAADLRRADRRSPRCCGRSATGPSPATRCTRCTAPPQLAETVDRRRDPLTGPYWAAKYLGYDAARAAGARRSRSGSRSPGATRRRARVLPFVVAVAMLRRLPRRPAVRAAADRPLRAHARGPARASSTGWRCSAGRCCPPGTRAPRLGDRRRASRRCSRVAFLPWHVKHAARRSRTGSTSRAPTTATCARSARRRRSAPRSTAAGRSPPPTTARSRTCAGGSSGDPGSVAPVGTPEARGARVLLLPRRTRAMKRFYTTKFPQRDRARRLPARSTATRPGACSPRPSAARVAPECT